MIFLYSKWLSLPLSTRVQIAQKFGIAKVRPTHVIDNKISDDGYNITDVESVINVDSLQNLLGSKEKDINVLWDILVTSLEPKPVEPEVLPQEEAEQFDKEFKDRNEVEKIEVVKRVNVKKVTVKKDAKTKTSSKK